MGIGEKRDIVQTEETFKSKLKLKLRSFFKFPLDDKKAYLIFFLIFVVLVLPIFIKPLGYIPAFRFYFEGLGEYFAAYYSPYRTQTFFSEIDSHAYYAYLPSMVIDHDFDFTNQFGRVRWNFLMSKKGVPI